MHAAPLGDTWHALLTLPPLMPRGRYMHAAWVGWSESCSAPQAAMRACSRLHQRRGLMPQLMVGMVVWSTAQPA